MLLAIDAGNTNIVVGCYEGSRLLGTLRLATDHVRTADEGTLLLTQFLQFKQFPAVEGVIIATVVPRLEPVMRQMAETHFGLKPIVVDSTLKLNITFDYPKPSEIGADRICNSVAAYAQFARSVIVVDFGTATTFDVISDAGAYLGGVIAPGVETSHAALAHRAAQLFKVSFARPKTAIGKSTEEALRSGFFLGAIGQIDYITEQITDELTGKPTVIATGGLAHTVAPVSKYIEQVLPDITLDGLRLIYEMNRPQPHPTT